MVAPFTMVIFIDYELEMIKFYHELVSTIKEPLLLIKGLLAKK